MLTGNGGNCCGISGFGGLELLILMAIAAGFYLLYTAITMSTKRKKRSLEQNGVQQWISDFAFAGKDLLKILEGQVQKD